MKKINIKLKKRKSKEEEIWLTWKGYRKNLNWDHQKLKRIRQNMFLCRNIITKELIFKIQKIQSFKGIIIYQLEKIYLYVIFYYYLRIKVNYLQLCKKEEDFSEREGKVNILIWLILTQQISIQNIKLIHR